MSEKLTAAKYVKVAYICEKYAISSTKAYQLVHAHGCPAVNIGGGIRVDAEAFDKWLKNDFPNIPRTDRRFKDGRATRMNPEFLREQREKRAAKRGYVT